MANTLNRLIDMSALTALFALAYQAGYLEALGSPGPPVTEPEIAALLEVARRRHWHTIEAVRAQGQAEEPPAPAWLRKLQGPADEENEGEKQQPGVGC